VRDLLLLALVFGLAPVALLRPHIGALAYHWVSLMNPHRLVWGFMYGQPIGQLFAGVTLAGWILTPERKRPLVTPLTWLLLAFFAWTTLTTLNAQVPEAAWAEWQRLSKIVAAALMSCALFAEERRLRQFVAVVALSIAFFGVKGGLFVLATGGAHLVWGPPQSLIGDNNGLALALVTILPLLAWLAETASRRGLRLALWGAFALTLVAVLGTRSRGGFVALLVTGGVLALRSRHRLAFAALALFAALVALLFLPPEWSERIASIERWDRDGSFALRLDVWAWTLELVERRPILGGGFGIFTTNGISDGRDTWLTAHSIVFQVLGEHGWPGLVLFLSLLAGGVLTARNAARLARGREELAWAARLGSLLEVSYVGYAAAGMFLSMAYYDLLYQLIAITILARALVREHLRALAKPGADRSAETEARVPPRAAAGLSAS